MQAPDAGILQQAIQDFDNALDLNPELGNIYYNRGFAYYCLKDYQQAIQNFDNALALNPDDAQAYTNQGVTYFDLKDYQQAIQNFDKALALYHDDTSVHYNRAIAYLWQNNIEHARADFTRTWELDATDIEAVWMTAWSSMCQEIPRTSIIERLETIAVIDSQHYLAQISKAVILYLNKNYHEALTVLEHAISILVHNDQPLIQLREMIS